jgi:GntR family transcriptional regulator
MNRDIPIPLYYKMRQIIIDMIENEEVKPGEMIPSENKLIEEYAMSRTTVRKAIEMLVNEGYLYRIQGKGTFVKGKQFSQGLIKLTSCTEDIRNQGLNPSVKLVQQSVEVPKLSVIHNLHLQENERVFFTERIMNADNVPLNKTKSYLPYKYFPGIERHDFRKESLYQVIENDYKVKIVYADRSIEAVLVDERTAEQLDLPMGSPILLFRGIVYGEINGRETPIEYFESKFRSDRTRFMIQQYR